MPQDDLQRHCTILNANNIPLVQLALRKGEIDKENALVVVCQSGNRSKSCGIGY